MLGTWLLGDGTARELLTVSDLTAEGEAMRHCVADYWDDCLARASRVQPAGAGGECP